MAQKSSCNGTKIFLQWHEGHVVFCHFLSLFDIRQDSRWSFLGCCLHFGMSSAFVRSLLVGVSSHPFFSDPKQVLSVLFHRNPPASAQ